MRGQTNDTTFSLQEKYLEFAYQSLSVLAEPGTIITVTVKSNDSMTTKYLIIFISTAAGLFLVIVIIYLIRCWLCRRTPDEAQNVALLEEQIKNIFKKSPETKYKKDMNKYGQASCPICLFNFEDAVDVRVLECGHIFHGACIYAWLKSKQQDLKCPICNVQLVDRVTPHLSAIDQVILNVPNVNTGTQA